MAKTFDQIDQARSKYALMTQEELESLTSAQVRSVAIECDIRYIERDGKPVRVSNGRKAEFIQEILKVCADKRLMMQVSKDLTEEQLGNLQGIAKAEDEKSEN